MPHGSKALRWNRDLCSWDSWSHLFQFNKHKKLLFYLRAICKWNWKMHSSCFSNYLKKWFVLYYKTSIHRKIGKWEQTECVYSWRLSEPVLCQRSQSSLYLSPQLSSEKFMYAVNRTLTEIGCLYYCHHKSLGLVILINLVDMRD